jgi:hypothetical protein
MNVPSTKTYSPTLVRLPGLVDLDPVVRSVAKTAGKNVGTNAGKRSLVLSALIPGSCAARRRLNMVGPGRRSASASASVNVNVNANVGLSVKGNGRRGRRSERGSLRVRLDGPRSRGRFVLNADTGVKSRRLASPE